MNFINEEFKYPNNDKIFKLVKIIGYKYYFDCGHWCTDSVFMDLIMIKYNRQVYTLPPFNQLKLF